MAKKPRWTEHREDGVLTFDLHSWRYFDDLANQKLIGFTKYIFRGQASAKWKLESTFDRVLRHLKKKPDAKALLETHLQAFKLSARGRRGPSPAPITDENDWWALGQHNGLATPLLDWTRSPFVAAYFAFAPLANDGDSRRVVYALQHVLACEKSIKVASLLTKKYPGPIEVTCPMVDENARLTSQGGVFTRSPIGHDLESLVRKYFPAHPRGILIKITIPDSDRELCLQSLNRMNINHLSLFPDIYGAAKFTNFTMTVPKYQGPSI